MTTNASTSPTPQTTPSCSWPTVGTSRPGEWSPDGRLLLYATSNGVWRTDPNQALALRRRPERIHSLCRRSWSAHCAGLNPGRSCIRLLHLEHRAVQTQFGLARLTLFIYRRISAPGSMTGDGRRSARTARDACHTACEPGPIDVLLLTGKGPQTLPYLHYLSEFVQSRSGSSVFWGSSALIRADSDGNWFRLDDVPRSVYRNVALSLDGSQLAFVRSYSGGAIAIEIDVTTGVHADRPHSLTPPRPRTAPATNPLQVRRSHLFACQPFHSNCSSDETVIQKFHRTETTWPGRISASEASSSSMLRRGEWVVLIKPDWCRRFNEATNAHGVARRYTSPARRLRRTAASSLSGRIYGVGSRRSGPSPCRRWWWLTPGIHPTARCGGSRRSRRD